MSSRHIRAPAAGCAALALSLCANSWATPPEDPTLRPEVAFKQGVARGARVDGGYAFKNLPYAAPPVGANRWRAPGPAVAWTGVRDASSFGPSCPQAATGWNDADAKRAAEDCLVLNVWTPRIRSGSEDPKLPVMVWVHGGGFTGGSASNRFTDGTKLMNHGVVVVTIEYRLGVFGFLVHPDLARENANHASGNYGLLDILAALRWVKGNIAPLGGDPSNVTAFGQSAGATAISWLIASERSHGLFQRAILQSGNAFGIGLIGIDRALAEQAGSRFGAIARLRRLPASDLIRRWQAFQAHSPGDALARPLLDVEPFRRPPPKALLEGVGRGVTVIAGSNSQEFSSDDSGQELLPVIEQAFGDRAAMAREYYFPGGAARPADPLLGNAVTQLATDISFRCGSILTGHVAARAWLYQFEQPRPGAAFTAHSHELVYVLGNEGEWTLSRPMTADEASLTEQMQRYWTQFARTGDPNGPNLPQWPAYQAADVPYLGIAAGHTSARAHLRSEICPLYVAHWSDPAAYGAGSRD